MDFFLLLLLLLLAAIILLQVARRLALPYPAMLAAAGVVVALIPGTPDLPIDPEVALAIFIAPALVDAAFDFPIGTARRYWAPLVTFAVIGVLVTTMLVAWLGWALAGLPIAAAIALGAIVAPPDAAAATAVLNAVSIPRNTDAVLKGESLFNDATALLLFSGALAVQSEGGLDLSVGIHLALAVPGGIVLGILGGIAAIWANRFVSGTLGGNLLQFVNAFLIWIVAERLELSAVLCVVAFAMTIASSRAPGSPRMRVHSFAVWGSVVFVLNVFAFLLMGMQAKTILSTMPPASFRQDSVFAGEVIATVIVTRIVLVVGYNRVIAWRRRRRGDPEPATLAQGVLVGWSGMRGLVTLATAFALPATFPYRDLIVLTAFGVVLATLVVQGLTLGPLIRALGLDQAQARLSELAAARVDLAGAGLATLDGKSGEEAGHLRHGYEIMRRAAATPPDTTAAHHRRDLGLAAIAAERLSLEDLRRSHEIGAGTYNLLQEELDWRELTLLPDEERQIEES